MHRWNENSQICSLMNFSKKQATWRAKLLKGNWQKRLDSSDSQWLGNGSSLPEILTQEQDLTIQPHSFALYEMK